MVENVILRNKQTSALLELDVVNTPFYILDKVGWGQIKGTHHSYKYVNQIGVYVTSTSLETRDVSVSGWIVSNSELHMSQRKSMLNRFVNPQQPIELIYKNYSLEFLPDRTIKYSATIKENNEVVCKFEIVGLAANPLFKDTNTTNVPIAGMLGMFHFPMMLSAIDNGMPTVMMGLRQPSLIVNISNTGSVQTGMNIVFEATGTVVNPSLINIYTQEQFKINKTLVAGETVVVSTTIGEKKIVGTLNGVSSNYFKYRDLRSSWLQLDTGDNAFKYDADNGIDSLNCTIEYSNKYLEVQECF
nr:MAG TPA: tail protein [Caudoviricetes sp.]